MRSGDLDAGPIISAIGESPQRPIGCPPDAPRPHSSSPRRLPQRLSVRSRELALLFVPVMLLARPPGCGNGRPAKGRFEGRPSREGAGLLDPRADEGREAARLHLRRRARLPAGEGQARWWRQPAARGAFSARRGRPGATSSREPAGCYFTLGGSNYICSGSVVQETNAEPVDRADGGPLRHRQRRQDSRDQLAVHPVVRHGADVHLRQHDLRLLGRRRGLLRQDVLHGRRVQQHRGRARLVRSRS